MKNKKTIVTIKWTDAVIYTQDSAIPKKLPIMTSTGQIYKETGTYIILKNVQTTSNLRTKKLPKNKANYYFIPKAMIEKIV